MSTRSELQAELKKLGLPATGTTEVLEKRLAAATRKKSPRKQSPEKKSPKRKLERTEFDDELFRYNEELTKYLSPETRTWAIENGYYRNGRVTPEGAEHLRQLYSMVHTPTKGERRKEGEIHDTYELDERVKGWLFIDESSSGAKVRVFHSLESIVPLIPEKTRKDQISTLNRHIDAVTFPARYQFKYNGHNYTIEYLKFEDNKSY